MQTARAADRGEECEDWAHPCALTMLSAATLPTGLRPLPITGEAKVRIGDKTEDVTYSRTDIGDGNERIEVTGPSALSRFATFLGLAANSISNSMLRRAAIFAAGAAGLGVAFAPQPKASGSLILDTSTDAAHTQAAQPYVNAGSLGNGVAIQVSFGGQTEWVSGFLLDPYDVATCAHCVESIGGLPYTIDAIVEGYNYNSPIFIGHAVGNGIVDPKFNPNNLGAGYDQAVIHTTPMPMNSPTTFGTANQGDILTGVGVGAHGSPSTGLLPQDGNFRAFQAPDMGPAIGDLSSQYFGMNFDSSLSNSLPLNGLGEGGDSGGQIVNALGQTVGMMAEQSGGASSSGATYGEQIDTGFYAANTSSVPEPSSIALVLTFAGGLLLWRVRVPSLQMSDYMASENGRIRRRAA